MEIPCNECGAKNPMGAIFCRDCGAKLDMENLKPKVSNSAKGGAFKLTKNSIKNLISLCLSIVIFGGLYLAFVDATPELPEDPGAQNISRAKIAYRLLTAPRSPKLKKISISPDWASHYLTKQLKTNQEEQIGDATLRHTKAVFDFYDENKIRIDLQSHLTAYGIEHDVSCSMVLAFENLGDSVEFTVIEGAHGKLPLTSAAGIPQVVTPRMLSLISAGDSADNMAAKIKELEIDDSGKLVIHLK
ncbi:MAG: hypothetical protein MK132_04355 [Lentisphaerales bacterium]|nr:hypothetical protein [Lentisphaerales bacterium]